MIGDFDARSSDVHNLERGGCEEQPSTIIDNTLKQRIETGTVLFAHVRGSIVHCIGFDVDGSSAKLEILEILQRNWPETMEHVRVYGVTGCGQITDDDRAQLRKVGGTVMTTVNGVVYAPVPGGHTSAGTSMRAHWEAEHAIMMVEDDEKRIRMNVETYVKDFEARGLQISSTPTFGFSCSNDGSIAVESTTGACVILGDFPPRYAYTSSIRESRRRTHTSNLLTVAFATNA